MNMKQTAALWVAILAMVTVQRSWAQSNPLLFSNAIWGASNLNNDQTATQSGVQFEEVSGNIFDDLNNIRKLVEENIRRIQGDNIITEAQNTVQQIGENIRELLQQGVRNFRSTLDDIIDNLRNRVDYVRNRIKREALDNLRKELSELSVDMEDLQDDIEQVRQKLTRNIQQREDVALQQWNNWAENLLEKVAKVDNKDTSSKSETIVDEFVNRYSNQMASCADEAEAELEEYERKVRAMTEKYESLLKTTLSQKVQNCLNSRDNQSQGRLCARQLVDELRMILRARAEIDKLSSGVAGLWSQNFEKRHCVVRTLMAFEFQKYKVEGEINQLLENINKNAKENETDNGDSETVTEQNVQF